MALKNGKTMYLGHFGGIYVLDILFSEVSAVGVITIWCTGDRVSQTALWRSGIMCLHY